MTLSCPSRPGPTAWGAVLTGLLLGAALLGSCRPAQDAPIPEPRIRALPFPSEDLGTWRVAPVLSPDGRMLAYVRAGLLTIRGTDTADERSLSLPDSGEWRPTSAAWHPDGARILTLERHRRQGWRLALTVAATGERQIVSRSKNGTKPPAVSPDGRHIAAVRSTESWDERDELHLIGLAGGAERVLVKTGRGDVLSSVTWSPRGDRVAFLVSHAPGQDSSATVETATLDGARTVLVRENDGRVLTGPAGTERSMAWLRDGRLLYVAHPDPDSNEAELRCVGVDPETGAALQARVLYRKPGRSLEALSASADSTLVLIARTTSVETRSLDLTSGGAQPAAAPGPGRASRSSRDPVTPLGRSAAFASPSPDGSALAKGSGVSDTVEIVDVPTGAVRKRVIVPGRGIAQGAAWSSDGTALYVSGVLTTPRFWIRRIPLTGDGVAEIVWASESTWAGDPVLAPHGARIEFRTREHRSELWRLEVPPAPR